MGGPPGRVPGGSCLLGSRGGSWGQGQRLLLLPAPGAWPSPRARPCPPPRQCPCPPARPPASRVQPQASPASVTLRAPGRLLWSAGGWRLSGGWLVVRWALPSRLSGPLLSLRGPSWLPSTLGSSPIPPPGALALLPSTPHPRFLWSVLGLCSARPLRGAPCSPLCPHVGAPNPHFVQPRCPPGP